MSELPTQPAKNPKKTKTKNQLVLFDLLLKMHIRNAGERKGDQSAWKKRGHMPRMLKEICPSRQGSASPYPLTLPDLPPPAE